MTAFMKGQVGLWLMGGSEVKAVGQAPPLTDRLAMVSSLHRFPLRLQ